MSSRLVISFSGGRTSAMMTIILVALCRYFGIEFVVLFANTGQEDEETLKFVDRCDRAFNLGVVYLEAEVDPRARKVTRCRVVTFETASRDGAPFEAVIAKYGIPNKNYPHCTRETKLRPIEWYVKDVLGWEKGAFATAVGIRADETDRCRADAVAAGIVYPMAALGLTKANVVAFWLGQAFDLYLPEHRGNCVWCWKKSNRKLLTLMATQPDVFAFPRRMEMLFSYSGAGDKTVPRRFFRGQRTASDLEFDAWFDDFRPFVDGNEIFDPDIDEPGGCGDSCEVFTSDNERAEAAA